MCQNELLVPELSHKGAQPDLGAGPKYEMTFLALKNTSFDGERSSWNSVPKFFY